MAETTAIEEGAGTPVDVQEETAAVTIDEGAPGNPGDDALALIAGKLGELGLAPDGDYDIAEVTCRSLTALSDAVERREVELAAANKQVEELSAATAKPKTAAAAKPAKARKISADAVKLTREGTEEERKQELLELIGAAEVVEIAFSNGKTEIAQLEPVRIMGPAWRATMVGVQLSIPELIVHGPAPGKPPYPVAGYGLFLDGELAAYGDRGEQLQIGGGSTHNVAPDIVF